MKLNLDSHPVKLTCPKCSQEINETLGRLKNDPQLICPGCGVTINIDASQFREGIQTAQKSLDDLAATLRKLGK